MTRPISTLVRLVACLVGFAASAHATPLDPNAFTSLGALPGGNLTVDSDALTIGGLDGVLSGGVAVFTFDGGDTIASGVTITTTGSNPVALLFQGTLSIQGTIAAGAGGAAAGSGTGAGSGGAGGGFGGAGGSPPGTAGSAYGDLSILLEGGSGGGTADGAGGISGGGIEIGALQSISVLGGSVLAAGGNGTASVGLLDIGGGGGSGGGIFLHAYDVSFDAASLLDASGGNGGAGGGLGSNGGGGGGGRVLVLTNPSGSFTNLGTVDVAGGTGQNAGGAGVFTAGSDPSIVPEPATLPLLALGLLGLAVRRDR